MDEENLGPEVLMSVLGHSGEIDGRTRFQKTVFLLKREKNIPIRYKFIPHLHGPYSRNMQMDLGFLSLMGLVEETHSGLSYKYTLTEKGRRILKRVNRGLARNIDSIIAAACKEFAGITTEELVARSKSILVNDRV
jgi:uncharacterized protein YwgA